MIEFLTHMAS